MEKYKYGKLSWSLLFVLIAWLFGGLIWFPLSGLIDGLIVFLIYFWVSIILSIAAFVIGLIEVILPMSTWKVKLVGLVSMLLSLAYVISIYFMAEKIEWI